MSDHTLTTSIDTFGALLNIHIGPDTPVRVRSFGTIGGTVLEIAVGTTRVALTPQGAGDRDPAVSLNTLEDFLTRCLDAVYDTRGRLAGVTDCPVCEGSGRVQPGADPQVEVPCVRCHGEGEIPIASLAHGEYPGGDAA